MGTQKNRLNETVLLSTQNICLELWVRKYLQFYADIFVYLNLCFEKQMEWQAAGACGKHWNFTFYFHKTQQMRSFVKKTSRVYKKLSLYKECDALYKNELSR